MAHELGQKLINVSYEGLHVCPQGTGTDVPGLMGYGDEKEIHGGEAGRWHRECPPVKPHLARFRLGVSGTYVRQTPSSRLLHEIGSGHERPQGPQLLHPPATRGV